MAQNETGKVWCENFLQTPSAQSEQDCYRFYHFRKASLEDLRLAARPGKSAQGEGGFKR